MRSLVDEGVLVVLGTILASEVPGTCMSSGREGVLFQSCGLDYGDKERERCYRKSGQALRNIGRLLADLPCGTCYWHGFW